MPVRNVPGHESLEYLLICHDADGLELRENAAEKPHLLSQRPSTQSAATKRPTCSSSATAGGELKLKSADFLNC